MIHLVRVRWKLWLRRRRPVASFCKHCGRDVHDYRAPDDVWEKVEPRIRHGYTLCYDCFCEECGKIGEQTVWDLIDADKNEA